MDDKHKRLALMILAKEKPDSFKDDAGDGDGADDEEDPGPNAGLVSAMKDLGEALKSGDWNAAAEAWRDACDIKGYEGSKTKESDDASE